MKLFQNSLAIRHGCLVRVTGGGQPSVGSEVEIPTSAESASSGKSKGVNLFLARQKQIADMMEAEEEAERAAEGIQSSQYLQLSYTYVPLHTRTHAIHTLTYHPY